MVIKTPQRNQGFILERFQSPWIKYNLFWITDNLYGLYWTEAQEPLDLNEKIFGWNLLSKISSILFIFILIFVTENIVNKRSEFISQISPSCMKLSMLTALIFRTFSQECRLTTEKAEQTILLFVQFRDPISADKSPGSDLMRKDFLPPETSKWRSYRLIILSNHPVWHQNSLI